MTTKHEMTQQEAQAIRDKLYVYLKEAFNKVLEGDYENPIPIDIVEFCSHFMNDTFTFRVKADYRPMFLVSQPIR